MPRLSIFLHFMPELPEVEVTRQGIAPHVEGRVLRHMVIREPRLRWPVPDDLADLCANQPLRRTERRGKYLLLHFDHGVQLVHLGMSGSLRVLPAEQTPAVHDHIDWVFDEHLLRLRDPRRFGAVLWHPHDAGPVLRHPRLAGLGIEPFDPRFSGAWLQRGIRGRGATIKALLLAGDIVVGVGNIYASESLFRARIHPSTPGHRLGRTRCDRLAEAVRATLADAIAAGGSSLRDFVHSDGGTGYFQLDSAVYGREGEPCRRCAGGIIRKQIHNQRATYYCPSCQK